jgi:hypothetical protein
MNDCGVIEWNAFSIQNNCTPTTYWRELEMAGLKIATESPSNSTHNKSKKRLYPGGTDHIKSSHLHKQAFPQVIR